MDQVFIRPAPGKLVRDPESGYERVPETGKLVAWNSFWQRRLNDCSITRDDIIGTSDAPKPPAVSKSTNAKRGG